MNISSAAGFLMNRAVKMATSLNQDGKGGTSHSAAPAVPNKVATPRVDSEQVSRRTSSAYRVSLSSSALRKGAMESLSA
jgi:hypothetical protein